MTDIRTLYSLDLNEEQLNLVQTLLDDNEGGEEDLQYNLVGEVQALVNQARIVAAQRKAVTVRDYFVATLGLAPRDGTLAELPIGEGCGVDCKRAIDAAKAYLDVAGGVDMDVAGPLLESLNTAIEIFWRG